LGETDGLPKQKRKKRKKEKKKKKGNNCPKGTTLKNKLPMGLNLL